MNARSFATAFALVTCIAVIAAMLTIKGPVAARHSKLDSLRYKELSNIARLLQCKTWRVQRPVLPQSLEIETIRSYCSGYTIREADLRDNETGANYRYVRKNDHEFEICAQFYDAQQLLTQTPSKIYLANEFSFNPKDGCISGKVREEIPSNIPAK